MTRFLVVSVLLAACKSADKSAQSVDDLKREGKGGSTPPVGSPDRGVSGGSGPPPPGGGGIQTILDGDLEIAAGSIDKDIVRKVVKDNVGKLQYCYEKTLLANPGIEGKVTATFTIAAEGTVTEVKAAGVHPDVEACVADAVKAFKFPPSGNKVEVSYPFTFKPA